MSNFIEDALSRKKQQSPQFEYMWRIQLPDIGESNKSNTLGISSNFAGTKIHAPAVTLESLFSSGAAGGTGTTIQSELDHRVVSFDLPFSNLEVRKNVSRGGGWKSAGNKDISQISMKMMEYEDGASLQYLTDWQSLAQNPNGTHNPPALYKKTIRLIRMAANGSDLHVSTCTGCFVSEIGNVNHAYDANGIVHYNVTISVDMITHEIVSIGNGAKDGGNIPDVSGLLTNLAPKKWIGNFFNRV